jgi:hypothetical protein
VNLFLRVRAHRILQAEECGQRLFEVQSLPHRRCQTWIRLVNSRARVSSGYGTAAVASWPTTPRRYFKLAAMLTAGGI